MIQDENLMLALLKTNSYITVSLNLTYNMKFKRQTFEMSGECFKVKEEPGFDSVAG